MGIHTVGTACWYGDCSVYTSAAIIVTKLIEVQCGLTYALESFSNEWEVVPVRFVPFRTVMVLHHDRAVSKHSDWLSDDFAHCD